jgi:serine/threonine-protein kinase
MLACPRCRKLFPSDAVRCNDDDTQLVPLEQLPEEDSALAPGAMVGEYQVSHKLGAGTFGDVYAGDQPLIGKRVAIKVLHRRFSGNAAVVSRFVAEARAVNRIRHRNIIDIFSFGTLPGSQPYFVMERLDGVTLGELLQREKRLSLGRAMPIFRAIAEGLDAAHEVGITHRDLKPDNIFLVAEKDGTYSPRILDFGVAKLLDDESAHKTATGAAIGTPSYMAPEQCRGRPIDHRADVYALGVVIHEVLTGQRLFPAETSMEVLFKHVSEPPPAMSSVCPELPAELDAPVLAMLAKSPAQRPASAGAAVAALAQRAGAPGSGPPSSLEREIAQREAPTMAEGAKVQVRDAAVATSGPVVITVDDAAAAGADSARTQLVASSPASGTLITQTPPRVEAEPPPEKTELEVPPHHEPPPPHAHAKKASRWPWAIAAAAAIGAVAFAQRGNAPASGAAPVATAAETAQAAPATQVSIRLSVTPADADVLVDGLRAGSASDVLVLPRSDQSRAIRLEKPGYEPQPLVLVPDRDLALPPVALRPTAAPAASATPKTPIKARVHDDLERPTDMRRSP